MTPLFYNSCCPNGQNSFPTQELFKMTLTMSQAAFCLTKDLYGPKFSIIFLILCPDKNTA